MNDNSNKKQIRLVYFRGSVLFLTALFWVVTIIMVVNYFKNPSSDMGRILAAWSIVSFSMQLALILLISFTARDFQRTLTKMGNERERVSKDNLEIIEALSSNYNAVYYANILTGELKFLQLGGRIQKYMGNEYSEKHPFEWYANAYCQKLVKDDYKEAFLRECNADNLREKLKDRDYYTFNYVGDKEGRDNYFQMKAAKVNGSENQIVVGFADVDDEVRAANEQAELVEGALAQAREVNRIKDSILDNITTQIVEPIDSIVEIARMLAGNESNTDSVKSSGNHILMETENLGVIINDIMEMNRINNDQFIIKRSKADIMKLLDLVEADIQNRGKEKNLQINFSRQIVHNIVKCDEKRFITILRHVAMNAINNSYVGGVINATIMETQVLKKKAYYDIIVEDFGSGMDEESIKILMNQDSIDNICIDPNGTRYLGLAITKVVLDLIGGKLEITSRRREGTTVIVKLCLEMVE
jgi:signal transduction histidine kinase